MTSSSPDTLLLAVCGAHMRGMALESQMQSCGARYDSDAQTDDSYRFYALTAKDPIRPGLIRGMPGSGAPIAVELWAISPAGLGRLMSMIDAPLGIGTVTLSDTRRVKGFVCEAIAATADAQDITELGSWRRFLATRT
ncbi:hypothetical protein KO516_11445 [Citreicella sp. C3M06]|uniref:allophanate hydrolase-related protein n=1 Tax=Citreicella sp. C3M06 TaxID=2841564 RepID=UPI001C086003|nr:hypothetical protein [Citreicella sp. C3M06]MBU2961424.1 hypothetical protein [Citreicella sp. C3M06]